MDWSLFNHDLVALLAILNPLGNVPLFLDFMRSERRGVRRAMAVLIAAVVFALLLFFSVSGTGLLRAFGITMPAFRIAGGVLLLLIGIAMMLGHDRRREQIQVPSAEGNDFERAASQLGGIVVPVAVPMLVGPGAITAVILLSQRVEGMGQWFALLGVLAAASGVVMICLLSAEWVERAVGANGLVVVTRLLGLLLCAIAVQFVLDGIAQATVGLINPEVIRSAP